MRIGLWSLDHPHAYAYIEAIQALASRGDVAFVGLADGDSARGEVVAARHGLGFFAQPDELLAQVDAVVITSANADHHDMALRAAEAGVQALVEKPLATTLADAWDMVRAFDDRGLILATAFPCPFSPAFQALLGNVRRGQLGKLLAVAATNRGTMPGGFFTDMERSGGGAVMDHTVHVVDLLRRLTGTEVERVYAEIGHGLFHEAWDDSGILSLEMADGTFATLDCSWSRPASYPTWGDVTLRVIGEAGNAAVDLFNQHLICYPSEERLPSWIPWGSDLNLLMIQDFIGAVQGRRPPRSTGLDGLRALEVALAAYASAERRQPVAVADLS